MKVVNLTGANTSSGGVLLLGGFDGMHVGHRRLLERAKEFGVPVGVMTIVGGKGEELFTIGERERFFASLGIDFTFEFPFESIRNLSAKSFLTLLEDTFSPCAFVCGDDFRFGKGAEGDAALLKSCASVPVFVEEIVKVDGEKVSSGKVKELLKNGQIECANALLGRSFFLVGEVETGRQIGRTICFPTANIRYPSGKFPLKKGVYETRVCIDGKLYAGITNFGARPTFDNDEVWTETHLKGFKGDLYGRTLCVEFRRFLREIRKFDSAEALKQQLIEDLEHVGTN